MQQLKVSVIIPSFNHFSFLEKRLESVFNQSYTNFEVILLDDASTDNSITLLNKYKNHEKVSYFEINKNNSGSPFKQWVKGIEKAKGDLIWIAESDDFCEVNFLESLIPFFNTDKIGIAFTNTYYHNFITNEIKIAETNFKTGIYNGKEIDFIYNWFFNNSTFRISNASSCVFKKSYINRNILIDLNKFRYSGDKFLWTAILNQNIAFAFNEFPLNVQSFHEKTTRYSRDILPKYQRNEELIFIYKKFGYNNPKIKSFEWRNEYGKRLILSFYYSYKLRKGLSLLNLLKGIWIVRFNVIIWKRIYWSL